MTRPHLVLHPEPREILKYAAKSKSGQAECLGGTIIWQGLSKTAAHLDRVALPPRSALAGARLAINPWVHLTMSPPPIPRENRDGWRSLARVALEGLGLPPDRIRWLAFLHLGGKSVDHLHAIVLPLTFSGEWMPLTAAKARCTEADRVMKRHLGLAIPRRRALDIVTPARRLKSEAARHIAETARKVLRGHQPPSFEAFQQAMMRHGNVRVVLSRNRNGVRTYDYLWGDKAGIRGRSISDDLTPAALRKRFAYHDRLRRARLRLEVRGLVMPDLPDIISSLKDHVHEQTGQRFLEALGQRTASHDPLHAAGRGSRDGTGEARLPRASDGLARATGRGGHASDGAARASEGAQGAVVRHGNAEGAQERLPRATRGSR